MKILHKITTGVLLLTLLALYGPTKPELTGIIYITISVAIISFLINFLYKAKKENHIWEKIIDKLNQHKSLIEYNTYLEQIISTLPINVKTIKKDNNETSSNDIFDKIPKEIKLTNGTKFFIEDKYYKIYTKRASNLINRENIEIITLLDITDEIEEEQIKETAFAKIAHDLKTPIYAISTALKLIKTQNAEYKKILQMCINANTLSKYLVENILTSYKLTNKTFQLNTEEFNLSELVQECENELFFISVENKIRLVLNLPKQQFVYADKLELKRVILNLIYNAITYAKPDSDVEITLSFNETEIHFTVKNESEYIPPEELNAILTKRLSIKNKYNKPGTGLGLHLSKEIIEAHNGELIAKSYCDNTNVFGFKLINQKKTILQNLSE